MRHPLIILISMSLATVVPGLPVNADYVGPTEVHHGLNHNAPEDRQTRCYRDSHVVISGFGIDKQPVYVDVGRCKRFHKHSKSQKQLPLEQQSVSCDRCRPIWHQKKTYHLLGGASTLDIIHECACVPRHNPCSRHSLMYTFFPDSPYEKKIDVGICSGHCKLGSSCVPTKSRTIAIPSPNGQKVVETVQECQCASECYRTAYWEAFHDHVINETSKQTDIIAREVDIGKCVGNCSQNAQFKCLMKSRRNPFKCLMSLKKKPSRCYPTRYTQHEFTSASGQRQRALAIVSCDCR